MGVLGLLRVIVDVVCVCIVFIYLCIYLLLFFLGCGFGILVFIMFFDVMINIASLMYVYSVFVQGG